MRRRIIRRRAGARSAAVGWIEHLRKLTIRKITDDSPDVQVPGLTASVGAPFDHYSPFCPWKRLIASVMVETLRLRTSSKGSTRRTRR